MYFQDIKLGGLGMYGIKKIEDKGTLQDKEQFRDTLGSRIDCLNWLERKLCYCCAVAVILNVTCTFARPGLHKSQSE